MLTVRKGLAAVLALTASSAAFAQIVTPTTLDQITGAYLPSDVFVVVANQTTGASEVIDLGISATSLTSTSTFESASGYTTQWSLDPNNLANNLGTGTLTFQLVAGDQSAATGTYDHLHLFTTGSAAPSGFTNGNVYNALNASVGTYLDAHASSFGAPSGSSLLSYVAGGASSWTNTTGGPNAPGKSLGVAGFIGTGTPGSSSLVMYNIASTSTDGSGPAATYTLIGNGSNNGVFTLSGTTLTYTLAAVSQVPLPAAAWLLISGLLGLGAAGRRRAA